MRSKKAIYNIVTNIILQIIVVIYGFVFPKIIISHFGSNVNGLISSITQFLGYIALLQSGFGAVVKSVLYKPLAQKNKSEIENILKASENFFKNIAKIFIVYIIILAILYPIIINNEFSYFYTFSLIIIISISIFAEYYFGMTYRLFLQADQKNYVVSIISIVSYILSIITVIILTFFNCNIHLIKLLCGLMFVIKPILQNYYVKKKYNITFEKTDTNYSIKNKWDGLAQHIASVIHDNTDVTLLTIFSTLAEVSVYSVYNVIVKGIKSLIESFSNGIDSSFGDMIVKNETDNLNKKFNMYETVYFTITTIIFSSTIILITPFVSIYTKGVTDVNYIRYTFGYLIVIAEYIRSNREIYHGLVKSAGHFKETRIGAWFECFINIFVSVILIFKYGIVGVAIGTIVAMTIRMIEFMYHSNKYILKRNIWCSIKKILIVIFETILIICVSKYLPLFENINYINWIINGIMIAGISAIITLIINCMFFYREYSELLKILKKVLRRQKK